MPEIQPLAAQWRVSPPDLTLAGGQLHVFRLQLPPGPPPEDMLALLDAEESARARRYHFQADGERFIRAHAQVRQVLASLVGAEAHSLVFEKNEYGKPFLAGSELRFNLSHSRDLGLLAVILRQEVGVDIEAVRPEVNHAAVAGRFFAPEELHAIRSLDPADQLAGFFHCWTRKEAYIKARGLGLKIPLGQFAVSVDPLQPARLIHVEPSAPPDWTLVNIDPGAGYSGAAVVQDTVESVYQWVWR